MKKYLTLILSIIFLLGAVGCGNDPDPAEQKKAALELDTNIFSMVTVSENTTNDLLAMLQGVSDGSVTLLDVYDAAESAVYMQTEIHSDLVSDDKNAKEYVDIAGDYVLNAFGIANNIKDYIDTNEMQYLSNAQTSIDSAETYAINLVAARMDYLSTSGFSNEEISQILEGTYSIPE